ncbi:MAG: methyltransferase domain-containing protein [Corynebacterium sp.]|nr:methyltransferase domain-containing protein [Corynebacterium sp.]
MTADDDFQAQLDQYWSNRASSYHDFQQHSTRSEADQKLWTHLLCPILGPAAAQPIVDVGTGSGYLAQLLGRAGYLVHGIDHAPGMLHEAQLQANRDNVPISFSRQHAQHLAFPTASLPIIINRYVLWTLSNPVAALQEWARVLCPGGKIIVIDAAWFPLGVPQSLNVPSSQGTINFADTYTAKTVLQLPLGTASGVDDYIATFHAAGLNTVQYQEIPELAALDAQFGVSPGHESRPIFLLEWQKPC